MRGRSVRFRITVVAVLSVAAVLVAASFAVMAIHRHQLLVSLDESLEQRADLVAAELGRTGTEVPNSDGEDRFVQVVGPDGTVLARSANLAGVPPLDHPLPGGRTQTIRTVDDLPIEDDTYRLLSRAVDTASGPGVLHVGENIDDVTDSTHTLGVTLLIVVPGVIAVLAALIWWLVGRALKPVEAIRAEVASIRGEELGRRVPQPATDDEIGRLARTMNEMLDRLDESAGRQRRLVADASHELRSPLARMRAQLEVDRAAGVDPATTTADLLREVAELQRLVDDLLYLAREGATGERREAVPFDVDDVVLREVGRLRAEGGLRVDSSGVSAGHLRGDPDRLGRAVRNLADNAARHARTTVAFSVSEQDGEVVLAVTDDGPGVAAGREEEIFLPFTRLDDARARDAGGAGLGLAITRQIVEQHGGTITLVPTPTGSRFVVRLPRDTGLR